MKMRKLFAGVVAAATMLGGLALGASTANAADGTPVTGDATFTFTASSADQLTGRDITAYKIGDYVQYGSDPVAYGVQSNAANKDAVKSALESALGEQNLPDDALTNALADGLLDASTVRPWDTTDNAATESTTRKFATELAKQTLNGTSVTLSAPAPVTGATGDGAYAATVTLPAGIYLFVDNTDATDAVTKAVPMIVASGEVNTDKQLVNPTKGATVNFKNTKNTDKTKDVTQGTASVGDVLDYTLTGKVANPAPESFVFTDLPGVGLTVQPDSFTVTADDEAVPDADYVVDLSKLADNKGDGTNVFTVTLNNLTAYAGKTIKVAYQAQVNAEATGDEVVNKLVKNDGSYAEVPTKLLSFSFTKVDAAGNGVKGATFTLSVEEGQTGSLPTNPGPTTVVDSNADGTVTFSGLKAGTYTVTETKVANGYQNVTATFTVDLNANGTYTISKTAVSDPFGLVDTADKTVLNVKSITQLPLTGAAGTALFTVIGLLLAGAAATVALKSRETKRALRA